MNSGELEGRIASVAALAEPVRQALYFYVASRPGDVSREEAARALRTSRALAAFHLDKLVEAGLLEVTFRRLSGRSGPGAGRPAKLYRRSSAQLEVSLPPRRYQLAASLFAQTLAEAARPATLARLERAARRFGHRLGREARRQAGPRPSRDRLLNHAEAVLRAHGFEPCRDGGGQLRLRNCPFDGLARDHRTLVCGMNLSLMRGLISGLGLRGVAAALDPQPGMCCVAFKTARA
ncbi:MAG: helix-turn-helix transcriptional regulator [Gemmatimonadales bacterium]